MAGQGVRIDGCVQAFDRAVLHNAPEPRGEGLGIQYLHKACEWVLTPNNNADNNAAVRSELSQCAYRLMYPAEQPSYNKGVHWREAATASDLENAHAPSHPMERDGFFVLR